MPEILQKILKRNGMEVIPENENKDKKDADSIDDKKDDKNKQSDKDDKGGSNDNLPPDDKDKNKDDDDIDEEKLIKALNKRGVTDKTIADLNKPAPALTDEEKRQHQEQKQNKVWAYGLTNSKITKNQIERYSLESQKDPIDLALDLYLDERKAELKKANTPEDKMPTEDDLIKEFNEYNHLEYEETDPKRIRREKELAAQAKSYLKNTYKDLYDLEKEFDEHESTLTTKAVYNSKIESAVSKVPTEFTFNVPDITDKTGKTQLPYKFKPLPDTINKLKEKYGSEEMFRQFGKSDLDVNFLANAIINEIKLMEFDRIVSELAHSHASAEIERIKKGRRNIIDLDTSKETESTNTSKNPVMKKLLKENQNLLPQT